MKKILITGSDGYIGYCLYKFLMKKYKVFGLDKSNKNNKKNHKINLLNKKKLSNFFKFHKPDIVFHLAGYSTIDNINKKRAYIKNNIQATKNLIAEMKRNKIGKIVFSSTAAVYNARNRRKLLTEKSLLKPNNIYGSTKLNSEKIIKESKIKYVIFRFFNVCSSIPKLSVGENHKPETHLIPLSIKKALQNKTLNIYGENYNTFDGTCIRDYVHIKDICDASEKSISYLENNKSITLNLGSAKGFSVKQIILEIKKKLKNSKSKIKTLRKRAGDVECLVCQNNQARYKLNWSPKFSNLNKIIDDEVIWQKSSI